VDDGGLKGCYIAVLHRPNRPAQSSVQTARHFRRVVLRAGFAGRRVYRQSVFAYTRQIWLAGAAVLIDESASSTFDPIRQNKTDIFLVYKVLMMIST
jgi:hypothetical protein